MDLVVASEESNVIILKTALVAEDIYHRQQGTAS